MIYQNWKTKEAKEPVCAILYPIFSLRVPDSQAKEYFSVVFLFLGDISIDLIFKCI